MGTTATPTDDSIISIWEDEVRFGRFPGSWHARSNCSWSTTTLQRAKDSSFQPMKSVPFYGYFFLLLLRFVFNREKDQEDQDEDGREWKKEEIKSSWFSFPIQSAVVTNSDGSFSAFLPSTPFVVVDLAFLSIFFLFSLTENSVESLRSQSKKGRMYRRSAQYYYYSYCYCYCYCCYSSTSR